MELKLKSLYEPLDIDIDTGRGTERVAAEVDVTPTNLARLARRCIDAQNKMAAIEALRKKGAESRNPEAIGGDSYDGLLRACGNGRDMSDADCTPVTAQVFRMVLDIVRSRNEQVDEKAAHYLPEESHAQTEPDPAA